MIRRNNHQKCSLGLLFTSSTSYTISTPDLQTTTFANRNRFLWLWTLASYTDLRLHAWVAGRGGAIWKWYKKKWPVTRLFLFHTVMEIAASGFKMATFKIWLCCLKDQMKDEIVTKEQPRWAQIRKVNNDSVLNFSSVCNDIPSLDVFNLPIQQNKSAE